MPIKVSCHCGQSFTAKDELRGQTLLCPKCHQPLTIGADATQEAKRKGGMDELFEEVGLKEVKGPRCPQCGAGLLENAVMCVECGMNFQTGTKLAGARVRKVGEQGHTEAADVLLDKAKHTIAEEKAEVKKSLAQGAPAWVYFFALALVIAFGATMLSMPMNFAFWYTGIGLMVLGWLISFVYGIRILIAAFMESAVQGLLCLFVPFYSLVYIIMRWQLVGSLFLMQILGGVVAGAGVGLQLLAPSLADKPDGEGQVRALPAVPSIVVSRPADAIDRFPQEIG